MTAHEGSDGTGGNADASRMGGPGWLRFTAWGAAALAAAVLSLYALYVVYVDYVRYAVPWLGVWVHSQIEVDVPLNTQGQVVYFYAPYAMALAGTTAVMVAVLRLAWLHAVLPFMRRALQGMRRNAYHGGLHPRRGGAARRGAAAGVRPKARKADRGGRAVLAGFVPGVGMADRDGSPLPGPDDPLIGLMEREARR